MKASRHELPLMARFALVGGCVYVVGKSASSFSPASILGALEDIGFLALLVPIVYYAYRAFSWLKSRVLWKVRNRILISYTFVAVFPLLVLGLVATLALLLTFRTMSGFYLEQELEIIADDLDEASQGILTKYHREHDETQDQLNLLSESVSSVLGDIPSSLQNLSVGIYSKVDGNKKVTVLQVGEVRETGLPNSLPFWIQDGFVDLVIESSDLVFLSVSEIGDFLMVGWMPFDQRVIDHLKRRTSIEIELAKFTPSQTEFEVEKRDFRDMQDFFSITWVHFHTPVAWQSGESESRVIFLSIPLEMLLGYFYEKFTDSGPLVLLGLVVGLFVLTILVSLAIGATLARSITLSIHNIYAGAKSIQAGDFDFRIPSKDRDQLDAMANSFNQMSASIVGLIKEVSEKERLEKEIEIAKEVQRQLFPQQLPPTKHLELAASCMPARQVSGDYYDFLPSGDTDLDIVVGDVSGKGISAALMMASIQSAIRSKLMGPVQPEKQTQRMVETVAELNNQIYHASSPETYSTLFLNHFNSQTRRLSYCNAGHHPPLVFSDGEVSDLTTGGTVVGLFESWNYEGAEVELKPGDLVVYFTDGVVEAESSEGEQFGTERLIDLIRSDTFLTASDIKSLILDQVFDWCSSEDQADDITVVCLKVLD